MKQILFVNACMRGPEQSRTWRLSQAFLGGPAGPAAGGSGQGAGPDGL